MIFILEDNDDRIEGFQGLLGDTHHHIERVVPEATEWLKANKGQIVLYCLDNDLYVPDYEGDEGEGWQLCEWILNNAPRVPIVVHSTNAHAATKMQMACDEAGWDFHRIVPYFGTQWIEEVWIGKVRGLLDLL